MILEPLVLFYFYLLLLVLYFHYYSQLTKLLYKLLQLFLL